MRNRSQAATDFTGKPVTTLPALDGATALALSEGGDILYAAIGNTDEIAAVRTDTRQEVALYFTSVNLFSPGASTPTAAYQLSGSQVYGQTWDSSGSALFAITAGASAGTAPTLNVIDVP